MKHLFWVLPDRLCGRSGPNQDPWFAADLKYAGVGAVLSVNDGDLVHPEDFVSLNIPYQCTPLSAQAPPRPGDLELCLERLPIAYEFVAACIASCKAVLVHCRQGKDRTGLFMAYFLRRSLGISPVEAVGRVKAVRPIAFSAEGWDEFALEVLQASQQ